MSRVEPALCGDKNELIQLRNKQRFLSRVELAGFAIKMNILDMKVKSHRFVMASRDFETEGCDKSRAP